MPARRPPVRKKKGRKKGTSQSAKKAAAKRIAEKEKAATRRRKKLSKEDVDKLARELIWEGMMGSVDEHAHAGQRYMLRGLSYEEARAVESRRLAIAHPEWPKKKRNAWVTNNLKHYFK